MKDIVSKNQDREQQRQTSHSNLKLLMPVHGQAHYIHIHHQCKHIKFTILKCIIKYRHIVKYNQMVNHGFHPFLESFFIQGDNTFTEPINKQEKISIHDGQEWCEIKCDFILLRVAIQLTQHTVQKTSLPTEWSSHSFPASIKHRLVVYFQTLKAAHAVYLYLDVCTTLSP